MTEKTIREIALNAIDQAVAQSLRDQFNSLALADRNDDGGTPLALKRFKNWLPHVADPHKKARAMVADTFKEEMP